MSEEPIYKMSDKVSLVYKTGYTEFHTNLTRQEASDQIRTWWETREAIKAAKLGFPVPQDKLLEAEVFLEYGSYAVNIPVSDGSSGETFAWYAIRWKDVWAMYIREIEPPHSCQVTQLQERQLKVQERMADLMEAGMKHEREGDKWKDWDDEDQFGEGGRGVSG